MLEGLEMQNETMGGARDTLVKELQVMPRRVPSGPVVVTTTTAIALGTSIKCPAFSYDLYASLQYCGESLMQTTARSMCIESAHTWRRQSSQ